MAPLCPVCDGPVPSSNRRYCSRGCQFAGMQQLQMAAERGHYLAPFAKTLLALAAMREKQYAVARANFQALVAEFPQNPLFTRELAKLDHPVTGVSRR